MVNFKPLLLLLMALLLTACGGGASSENSDPKDGFGSLQISFNQGPVARTITSTFNMDIARYDVEGAGPQGASFNITGSDSSVLIGQLVEGEWSISVNAYNAEDILIAAGSTIVTVVVQNTVVAKLAVVPFSGSGELELTVNWPAEDVLVPSLQLTLLDSNNSQITLSPNIDAEAGSATVSTTLDTGYYTLVAQLLNADQVVIGHTDVVQVIKDQISSGVITFESVNSIDGAVTLVIEQRLGLPIELQLTDLGGIAVNTQPVRLVASAPHESEAPRYNWYQNGDLVQEDSGDTFSYVPADFEVGVNNFSVVAQTQDRLRAGSASELVTLVGADIERVETISPESSFANAAVADFNGDGFLDIVGGVGSLSSVDKVLLNDGDGTFTDTFTNLTGYQTLDVTAGDIDGDGDSDILLATTVGIFLVVNDGTGQFSEVVQPIVPRSGSIVELSDLDGDSDMDLVVGARAGSGFYIFENDGSGIFTEKFSETRGMSVFDIDVTDLNADGTPDILLTLGNAQVIKENRFYLNDGNWGFLESTNLIGGEEHSYSSTVADFNSDGHVDIVVSGFNSADLYAGNGMGQFVKSGFVANVEGPRNLSPLDINGDGLLDVVISRYGSQLSGGLVYLNIGDGNFIDSKLELPSIYSREVLSADFDQDGDVDFIFATSRGMDVYKNNLITE
jgi:hypothetical protein